jgi:hypothetical protein
MASWSGSTVMVGSLSIDDGWESDEFEFAVLPVPQWWRLIKKSEQEHSINLNDSRNNRGLLSLIQLRNR